MSLINEALRKARTAHPAGTGMADGPEMHPVDADPRARGRSIFTLPFLIAAVLVLAMVLIWAWYRAGQVIVVRGNSNVTTIAPAPRASEPSVAATPTSAPTAATIAPVVAPAKMETTTATAATPIASAPDASASGEIASTNVLKVAEAPKPAGPVYKLEGIFYRPNRPAAVVNGELVYVGSPVEDGRVVAIDSESATVVTTAGQTNLLVLTR